MGGTAQRVGGRLARPIGDLPAAPAPARRGRRRGKRRRPTAAAAAAVRLLCLGVDDPSLAVPVEGRKLWNARIYLVLETNGSAEKDYGDDGGALDFSFLTWIAALRRDEEEDAEGDEVAVP